MRECCPLAAINTREKSLRRVLADRPKNARKMSELALLLAEKDDTTSSAVSSTRTMQNQSKDTTKKEAVQWARRAIHVAPNKPYGNVALSILLNAEEHYDERIQALQSAVACIESPIIKTASSKSISSSSTNTVALWVTRAVLLVRLLLEPRIQEAARITISKASLSHPSRRPLNDAEMVLYQEIEASMAFFASTNSNNSTVVSAIVLNEQQQETLALRCDYRLGLFLRKKQPAHAYRPLARHHLERTVQSLETLEKNDDHRPHEKLAVAKFWLATTTVTSAASSSSTVNMNMSRIDRCPKDYVIGLYSTFAERFDDLLVEKLSYQTPTLLRQLVNQVLIAAADQDRHGSRNVKTTCFHKAMDLGCGTGLSGMAFRDIIAPGGLMGVDLSPHMIAKARQRTYQYSQEHHERPCYDVLLEGDLDMALDMDDDHDHDESKLYSLVFACDVFCYIGDLQQIFQRVYKSLTRYGGLFSFSTELLHPNASQSSNDSASTGNNIPAFQLHECARFAHSRDYLNGLARECGFCICETKTCPIRKNQGKNVDGLLYVLRKGCSSADNYY